MPVITKGQASININSHHKRVIDQAIVNVDNHLERYKGDPILVDARFGTSHSSSAASREVIDDIKSTYSADGYGDWIVSEETHNGILFLKFE